MFPGITSGPFPCTRPRPSPRDPVHYNFRRDPTFMTEEHASHFSAAGMPTAADVARHHGVPPIAIPYMALQNVNRPDGTGKRIIVPMVTGFESTFLANSLQGLLCLPGCESVLMGEPVGSDPASLTRPSKDESAMLANEEETAGISLDGGDTQSARSSPLSPNGMASPAEAQRAHAAGTSPPSSSSSSTASAASSRSPSSNASDVNSLGPFGEMDPMTEEAAEHAERMMDSCAYGGEHHHHRRGSPNNNGGGRAARVLRGGIRCHGSARMKTAVSRTYADFVLQHLDEGEIQLKTPAPRSTSAEAVTAQQLDDAGELETLRGQTPNVPRCLAPVALPEERADRRGWKSAERGSAPCLAGLYASSLPSHNAFTTSTTLATATSGTGTRDSAVPANTVSVMPSISEADKVLPTTSEHSCSDNSPTPSSGDEDGVGAHSSEDGDHPADVNASGDDDPHHRVASSHALTGETRVGLRHGAQDGRRFVCFASNSVETMPEYHFPRLASDDLVDLTAFMVVRSSVQPDEAVDLDLASHILGNPRDVALLPAEAATALVNRAARLMEAAVFLQI